MTYTQLFLALTATGYPVAEGVFSASDKPDPPYITMQRTGDNAFYADGEVFWYSGMIEISLITSEKDEAAESKVRQALRGTGYKWTEARNAAQSCYVCTITLEV